MKKNKDNLSSIRK